MWNWEWAAWVCTVALQSVSRSENACTEWRFVSRRCGAAPHLLAGVQQASCQSQTPCCPSLQKFSVEVTLRAEGRSLAAADCGYYGPSLWRMALSKSAHRRRLSPNNNEE